MPTQQRVVPCPVCGSPGVLALIERRDPRGRGEGHEITFECTTNSGHAVDEVGKVRLWAATRANDAGG